MIGIGPNVMMGGASGFDIGGFTYTGKSVNFNTFDSTHGIKQFQFSDDGLRLFTSSIGNLVGYSDLHKEYSLTTPYDMQTLSFVANKNVQSQDAGPYGIQVSPDGTKMYMGGAYSKTVFQYTLSTPYSFASASYSGKYKLMTAAMISINTISFSSDGLTLIAGYGGEVWQYTLSTAWDISTAVYASKTYDCAGDTPNASPYTTTFSPDGTMMFLVGYSPNGIYQYALSTPWDISTLSYTGSFVLEGGSGSTLHGHASPDGERVWLTLGTTVYEFA